MTLTLPEVFDLAKQRAWDLLFASRSKVLDQPAGWSLIAREVYAQMVLMADAGELRHLDVRDGADLAHLVVTVTRDPVVAGRVAVDFNIAKTPLRKHAPLGHLADVVAEVTIDAGGAPPRRAILFVLGDEDEVVQRHPALRGHVIAFLEGNAGTAQIAGDPRVAWDRLAGEHGPIEPADPVTRSLLGGGSFATLIRALSMVIGNEGKR